MALTPDMLTVYDKKTDRDVVEDGDYTIMIASSSQVKLQTTFNIKGEVIPDSNEKVSDYLQSETNIQEKGYMLGDIKKPSHKGKKVKVIGIVMLVVSIILVALIGILHFGGIISISTQVGWQVALGLSIGLVILSLGVVIVAHFVAKSAKDDGEVLVKSATSNSSPEDQKSYERLFEEQFGNEDKKKPTAKVEVKDTSSDETDILRFVDSTITADVLCNRLSTFATERGLAVDANTSRKIISALCASRLLFLRGEKETSEKLLSILGEFFGGKNYLSTMEHCENIDGLFYTVNESGVKSKTQFAVANEEAKNVQQNAYFSAIEGVATEDINTMFLPFIKYINNPYGNYSVFCGGEKIDLPSNLWFVVILDKNSQIKKVDSSILDCANILNHNIKLVEEKEEKTAIKPISCYQLVKLTTDAFENDFLDETWWKKVDAIEEYFNSISPFHISNKKCQRLEKYSSVFILSGGEAVEAVDNMLASEVLFTAMRITDGKKSEISVVLKEQLENILGEDSCSECKNAISIYEAQA
jgi:hypothetical protein